MATRRKVVVARNLGPDVMSLLDNHPELEVSAPGFFVAVHRPTNTDTFILQVVAWPHEKKPCDRKWLLENVPGAYGVLVMYFDKVYVLRMQNL